jgi:hypothetical protein
LNALSVPIGSATLFLVLFLFIVPVHATGLYIDLPSYFSSVDTASIELVVRHADLQRAAGRASVFSGEFALWPRQRFQARFVLHYTAMKRDAEITNAVGDGIIHGTYRLTGDTLDVNGVYARGYVRLPLGPKRMPPFSYGSLDVGVGFEFRLETEMFRVRCAQSYILVGERRKPVITAANDSLFYPFSVAVISPDAAVFNHRNFFLLAVGFDVNVREGTIFSFAGYGFRYRGGDAREAYLVTIRHRLSRQLELCLNGGCDAGEERERVFNSLLSVSLAYRFLPREDKKNGK